MFRRTSTKSYSTMWWRGLCGPPMHCTSLCTQTAKQAFCVAVPNVWNSLPTDIHYASARVKKNFLLLHTHDDTPTSADNIKLLWLKCENVTETKNDHTLYTEIHYFLCFVTEGVNNNDYLFCILLLQISDQFEYVLAYSSFTPKYNILGTFAWIRSLSVLANLVHAGVQF